MTDSPANVAGGCGREVTLPRTENEETQVICDDETSFKSEMADKMVGSASEKDEKKETTSPSLSASHVKTLKLLPTLEKDPESGRTKSPVTVQEWVATLQEHQGLDDELPGPITIISTQEDNLHLGAEAGELSLTSIRQDDKICLLPKVQREHLSLMHDTCDSMQSDETSISSHSSIDSLLQARQEDPEELLYSLGFGSGDENFIRIPERFLRPSRVPGIDIQRFLEIEEARLDTMETGLGGFSGILEGYAQQISPIVSNILEIMCEQNKEERRRQSMSSANAPIHNPSFKELTKKMMTKSGVLDLLKNNGSATPAPSTTSSATTTILDPANKEFLDRQGRLSPRPNRKLVLGDDTYDIDKDGSIIECGLPHSPRNPAMVASTPDGRRYSKMSFMSSTSANSDSDDEDERHAQIDRDRAASSVFSGRKFTFSVSSHKPVGLRHSSSFSHFKRFPHKRSSTSSISSWESDRTPGESSDSPLPFSSPKDPFSEAFLPFSVQPIVEESGSLDHSNPVGPCLSENQISMLNSRSESGVSTPVSRSESSVSTPTTSESRVSTPSEDEKIRHPSESHSELSTTSSRTNVVSEGSMSEGEDMLPYDVCLRRTRSIDIVRPRLVRQERVCSVDDGFLLHKPKLQRQVAIDEQLWPLESGEMKQREKVPDIIPEIEISSCLEDRGEERSGSAQSDSSGFHEDDEKTQGMFLSWPNRRSSCDSSVSDETVRLLDPNKLDVCESDTCTLTPDVGLSDTEFFGDSSPKLNSKKEGDTQKELEMKLGQLMKRSNSRSVPTISYCDRTNKVQKSKSEPWSFYRSLHEPPSTTTDRVFVSKGSIEFVKQTSLGEDKGYTSASSEISQPKASPDLSSRSLDGDFPVQQKSEYSEACPCSSQSKSSSTNVLLSAMRSYRRELEQQSFQMRPAVLTDHQDTFQHLNNIRVYIFKELEEMEGLLATRLLYKLKWDPERITREAKILQEMTKLLEEQNSMRSMLRDCSCRTPRPVQCSLCHCTPLSSYACNSLPPEESSMEYAQLLCSLRHYLELQAREITDLKQLVHQLLEKYNHQCICHGNSTSSSS